MFCSGLRSRLGDALLVPFLGDGIDAAAVELQRLGRQGGQSQLAPLAQADEAMRGDAEQLAFGRLRELAEDFDGFVPLTVGQQRIDAIQLSPDGRIYLVELDGVGELELAAREHAAPLGRSDCGQPTAMIAAAATVAASHDVFRPAIILQV